MPPLLPVFAAQLTLAIIAFVAGTRLARARRAAWITAASASLAVLLSWPLLRFFPVRAIDLLGAPAIACIELTAMAIPAVLFFAIAARHVPRRSDARAILLLTAAAGIYFVRAGWWMVSPGVPDLGPARYDANGVCLQSTEYTCVAASMVTLLRAQGVPANETEMARLAFTQVGGGATDSRTLWALQRKLQGTPLTPRYHRLDAPGLIAANKPCLVQLDWGFFVSHMVPVLDANADRVVLGDPLTGRRELPMPEFLAKWKKNAITLDSRSGPR